MIILQSSSASNELLCGLIGSFSLLRQGRGGGTGVED